MRWAYVDSSLVVATILNDGSQSVVKKMWKEADRFISSFLLEAEVLSVAKREKIDRHLVFNEISKLGFIRIGTLYQECSKILEHGYLRGADLHHLATALWIKNKYSGLKFLSLDEKQKEVANIFFTQ